MHAAWAGDHRLLCIFGGTMDYETIMQANLDWSSASVIRPGGWRPFVASIRNVRSSMSRIVRHRGTRRFAKAVTELLASLPPDFSFTPIRPALGHNGVGRLQWRAGSPGGPAAVTGTDIAHIEAGVIQSLHVFLDQPEA